MPQIAVTHLLSDAFGGRQVLLVRHAEAEHNVSASYAFDPPLTEQGRAQCAAAAQSSSSWSPDVVLVSPLRRTLQTACALFPGLKIVATDLLREVIHDPCNLRRASSAIEADFGDRVRLCGVVAGDDPELSRFESFAPQPETTKRRTRGRAKAAFLSDGQRSAPAAASHEDWLCVQGESNEDVRARVAAVVEQVASLDGGGKVALVTHGVQYAHHTHVLRMN